MSNTPTRPSARRIRTESATMLTETTLANRYEVRKRLGCGGMAHVYLAHDNLLMREVAIKVLRGELERDEMELARFKSEGRFLARVDSAHVAQIYDMHFGPDLHYLVMQRCAGATLASVITTGGAYLPNRALDVAADVLAALADLHAGGIVHRDIKPTNVLIGNDGRAMLLDLGVAVDANDQPHERPRTTAGTPGYMSPEQRETGRVDVRSDLYQVGLLLFYAATCVDPSTVDVPKLAMALPAKLATVVGRAIARDPAKRYQTATEMTEAIRRAGDHTIAIQLDDIISAKPSAKRKKRSKGLPFALAGAAAAVAAAVLAWPSSDAPSDVAQLDMPARSEDPRRAAPPEPLAEAARAAMPVAAPPAKAAPIAMPRAAARQLNNPTVVNDVAPNRAKYHSVPTEPADFLNAASRDEQNGATEAAIAGYRQYLRLNPDSAEVRDHLMKLQSGR